MTEEVDPTETKPCSTCAEPIKLAAKKCTKCGSYQDFRRVLVVSSPTISVLGAAVAVAAAAYQWLGPVFKPAIAEPEIALVGSAPGMLTLNIKNRGSEAIYIDGAQLSFGQQRGGGGMVRLTMLQRSTVGVAIPGDAATNINFVASGDIGPFDSPASHCSIWLSYGHLDKTDLSIQPVSCVRLSGLSKGVVTAQPIAVPTPR